MADKPKSKTQAPKVNTTDTINALRYSTKRKNIPAAGLEAQGRIQEVAKIRYDYNPHLPPLLRSAKVQTGKDGSHPSAVETDELLALLRNSLLRVQGQPADRQLITEATQRPLTMEEAARLQTVFEAAITPDVAEVLAAALRRHEPWLEWSGKREKPWFEVEPVALHIHERISTQAILRILAREDVQRDLFADTQQSYAEAVQFYRHDVDWSNRMILGDSLQVMASLARREDLAGKVQMIYLDPPYGIKFSSNFQPQLGQRDVKDREQDLTREPEMVKAYRDTWTLGIHSYLAYLRDRLAMAKELLTDSGSIFVQIGDENLHHVRELLDEIFFAKNFCGLIAFSKTGLQASALLPSICDFVLWYAKDKEKVRFSRLLIEKKAGEQGATGYTFVDDVSSGHWRSMMEDERGSFLSIPDGFKVFDGTPLLSSGSSQEGSKPFEFEGLTRTLPPNAHWKTNNDGLQRLVNAGRIISIGNRIEYKRYLSDFGCTPQSNVWLGLGERGFTGEKVYVVQTANTVIERCLLMTTDPGDLVLDPTCGSGTTAFVAEQWGRRWITMDTSRVALALAKQRLLTARFPYYTLRPLNADDLARNPNGVWLNDINDPAATQAKPHVQNTATTPDPRRTFLCKTVPHITLKSIARNTSLDPIFAQYEPLLAEKLAALNAALKSTLSPDPSPASGRGEQKAPFPGGEKGWGEGRLIAKLIAKLEAKARDEGIKKITEADCRRWLLPGTKPTAISHKKAVKLRERIPPLDEWREWEVPFDTDPDWPPALQAALIAYRQTWRAKMDAVNACISAHADREELVDKPEEQKGVIRVSGPFTLEGVIALEEGPDSPIGGAPESLDSFAELDQSAAVINAEAHLDKILRLLKVSGVDFPGNQNVKFTRLEAITSPSLLHAEGEWAYAEIPVPGGKLDGNTVELVPPPNGGKSEAKGALGGGRSNGGEASDLTRPHPNPPPMGEGVNSVDLTDMADASQTNFRRVAVSIGPAVGNLTAFQVEDAVRAANRKGYDDLVFAAFGFDAMAQDAIVSSNDRDLRTHMALIRPDVAMDELLKTQPGSQIFTVFASPRIKGPTALSDGEYTVEVEGMDVYDPVSNQLYPTDKDRIAAWFLDSDYDGRTFCICQAFFPDKSKWAKLAKALGEKGVIDEEKFAALSGLVSLPFHRPIELQTGKVWRVAVKVIDPRGNEGLRVVEVL